MSTLAGSLFLETWRRDADRLNAIAVTLLRPSKLKWELGNFGTFTAPERIYARTINLGILGADVSNYWSGLFSFSDPFRFTPLAAGAEVVALGSSSVLGYVLESDVAAVQNPTATLARMLGYLARDAALTHYQARAVGAKTESTLTTITPGSSGSMILEVEGQGYEVDVVGTVSAANYNIPSLASKSAMTADGTNNEWVHNWFGRVPLLFPIAATMDAKTFAWGLRVFSAQATYNGLANARVAALPADWDVDAG
jgi:hypothetical protein